jgi:hypothetical protein
VFRIAVSLVLLLFLTCTAFAGTGYEVTSSDGEKTVTYNVRFGGGMFFQKYTAFDPASKKFVYLTWKRDQPEPKPVSSIWDHETGRTIALYQFPGAKHPLPVIPSIEAMKVCPVTGDKDFKYQAAIAID